MITMSMKTTMETKKTKKMTTTKNDEENNDRNNTECGTGYILHLCSSVIFILFCRTKLHYQSYMAACGNDILKLSTELMNCVRKNDIIGARCLFFDITEKEDRKLIVAKRDDCNHDDDDDCNAPLFEAVVKGNAEMVNFLVKECNADLEERGGYFKYELMTPLLCAALLHKLEVVRCLNDHGADINAVSPMAERLRFLLVTSQGQLWLSIL